MDYRKLKFSRIIIREFQEFKILKFKKYWKKKTESQDCKKFHFNLRIFEETLIWNSWNSRF